MGTTMNVSRFHTAVLQLAVEDHEILSQFTKVISRMFSSKSRANAKKAAKAISVLTNKTIAKHFIYEEQKVFAPLLAERPKHTVVKLVKKFQAEHKTLLKQIKQLERILTNYDITSDANVLWKALIRFLDNFESHANKEDEFFHLLLDGIKK